MKKTVRAWAIMPDEPRKSRLASDGGSYFIFKKQRDARGVVWGDEKVVPVTITYDDGKPGKGEEPS